MKEHKGRIENWQLVAVVHEGQPGFMVTGRFLDHSRFKGRVGHTSPIVSYDTATGELETVNSRYTLVGEPKGLPISLEERIAERQKMAQALEAAGFTFVEWLE